MIDDTLEKREQLHLIYGQPLRLVAKGKSGVSGSTKAVKRDKSKVLPTQPSSSRPKTASDPHFREGIKGDKSKVLSAQSSSRPRTASYPHILNQEVIRDNSKVLPTQPSSSRSKTAFDPYFREGVKPDNSEDPKTILDRYYREGVKPDSSNVLPNQPSSRPKTAFDPYFRGVKHNNSEVLPTQSSSSRPKTVSDPHFLIREGVRSSSVPSSSTSVRKRPSDTPDSRMKKQKTGKYPGCPACGGPHHLVKDCPITAEGPKRYFFLVSDFMTSLLTTLWIVYALQSSDCSLNRDTHPLSLLSMTF